MSGKDSAAGELAEHVSATIRAAHTGENNAVSARLCFHREMNVAMQLATAGLEKIKIVEAVAAVQIVSLLKGMIVQVKVDRCFDCLR